MVVLAKADVGAGDMSGVAPWLSADAGEVCVARLSRSNTLFMLWDDGSATYYGSGADAVAAVPAAPCPASAPAGFTTGGW